MSQNVESLVKQIEKIRNQIQEKGYIDRETYKSLDEDVERLKSIIHDLDKDLAVNSEKQSAIYIQLDRLDEKIDELKKNTKSKDDKKKDTTEKVLLLVLGAILSFVFNKFT
uniref:Hemolysin n=1 Tax=Mammaliicoccus phage MSShimriz1 TaxID=3230127 RepID=A0AAU8GRX9_9VIRU